MIHIHNLHQTNLHQRILTPEQQRLINMYINQYNQTNSHIEILLNMLSEIRANIFSIINITQSRTSRRYRRPRINSHIRNSNVNGTINQLFDEIQNNNMYYDLNHINTYNDLNTFDIRNDLLFNRINTNANANADTNSNIGNNTNTNINNNYVIPNDYARSVLANFLNSLVIVRPTTEQLENASRLIRFGDITNTSYQCCPISLDEFNDDDEVRQLLQCKHIFNPIAFQEWFSEHVICPVCRYDIRNYSSVSRIQTTTNNATSEQPTDINNTQTITSTTNNTTSEQPQT